MKRLYAFSLLLTMLLGLQFNASALTVTLEWEIPGSVIIRTESVTGDPVSLAPDQTSYIFHTDSSYGYVYAFAAEGYYITGAATTDGSREYSLNTYTTPNSIIGNVNSSVDGKTIKINVVKIERDDTFSIDVVNGAQYFTASFNSEYTLDLTEGNKEYKFNPEIDRNLTLYLNEIPSAYKVTLNGEEIEKNFFNARYDIGTINPGDRLFVQAFEGTGPASCTFTIEYGAGMEGCLLNIYNRSTGKFIYPDELVNNSISVIAGTELRVNFVEKDYTITKLLLNGTDVTADMSNNSFIFNVTDPSTLLRIEGNAKEYADINFTGYIINADEVDFSLTYGGDPFPLPEGEAVTEDIRLNSSITMPAGETEKYVISISEKQERFFFSPKKGYYIEALYTLTPEGKTEQHSGSASISAALDGTTFYMVVKKLPEEYTATLNVIGEDFYFKISATQPLSDNWNNPPVPSYPSAVGEREISFLPGYGTPIAFSFIGEEDQSPALYLDGGEIKGVEDSESGARVFSVTPYSPAEADQATTDLHSTILVYNSFKERPEMSGASLELEEGAEAEFFYSPVMHTANPAGQPVISGTIFTVRPAAADMAVSYRGEAVALDENGEFVFAATGNPRNNIVKVSPVEASVGNITWGASEGCVSVFSIDGRMIMENGHPDRIRDLEKGVYIVNGKKVLVK